MKKRVLSAFMALALCLTLLPVSPAWAKEADAPEGGITTVSEQGGTNEEENGAEGGQQNTGTPDAGGAEDSKADAPESGEDENAGNNADAQSGVHTHCVCGGNGDVNGHKHDTAGTEWTTTDSLPNSAGSYYLTQSVSGGWTVPEGEVNLCLNGQTIDGSIKVGSGATLTLTDCSGNGKVQGEVTVNGGKFELYGGTIIGGVEVGRHSNPATGSAFTMYGGTISGNTDTGGVFLVGTTNDTDPPRFTMHGGTISDNTAGASDGGGGGVYVGEKCSFTMDGGTITGNTATAGNGGGIYIHFNAGNVSISNATITGNKASATGNTSYGHGGGIYSERGVTVKNVTITGNNSTYEGGGIYGKGAITLTDATVTDNSQYDVYYDGKETTTPELTVSGSVKAGYYANYAWKLPILVSGALREDSVIRVGVREGINLGAIAEPASGVTLRAENFKADAADCVTSLGEDGKVYLVPCTHEMDDTGYTCKKCHTQFDARIGESAYYKTLTEAFDAARGSTVTLLRDVTLTGNCSATDFKTLDLNGKTVSTKNKYIGVGGGNKPNTLTVKDSGTGGGTQALDVTFYVSSNGTLAVDNSYTGKISRVELQAGGTLERFGGEIGELVLSNVAYGSTSTGYGLKLWNGNTNACTIGKFTDNTTSKSLTVKDLLKTNHAKCELYGENSGTWSVVDKSTKIAELTGYTAYKVQFPECVHQCADDSNPVCSVCHKKLYTKITAKAADGTTKTAYFTEDSALENGYVEAIQTLNGWSNEGCTEPTLTLLRDMYAFDTSMPLTGTLTLKGGTHTAKNVTVAENANVTFASGSYRGATIDGTATVKEGVTFTDASVEVNGTLNAKGGTFNGPVKFKGSSIANISGGSFNNEKKYGGVTFDYNVTGTITGGTFTFADFYTTKVKLSGGTFTMIKTNGDRKLADLLAEGAAYYGASDNQAVTNDGVNTLENVKVVSHTHNGGTDGKGICSVCKKQMAASLTIGDKTSWYAAFATAIEAANAADGEKTITLYQDVNGYADGHSTTYELTRGPVTLATGGKKVTRVVLIAKGISLTVTDTGSNGGFNVTVDGKGAELTVNDGNTELAIVTAQNGGKLSLSNGTFSRVDVMNDGSSASLSGGSYGEITSGTDYVKPYALLAKGYAYKKEDNTWVSNANIGLSKVTVEKAPFEVEKIYPNNDTNYTGNSAFATDGNITLTAVIKPGTENVSYQWQLFRESDKDWLSSQYFHTVNNATHTGAGSKTLSISNLPENSSYQYRVHVWSDNGYQCDSEPFTVTRHQHSWTYTASGATITASCTDTTCTSPNGGSVTIIKPAHTVYGDNQDEKATTSSTLISSIQVPTIVYSKDGQILPYTPVSAGEYTASITLGGTTASVNYTVEKATQYGKVSMAGYTYGQAPSTPTLTDRTGDANAQVTYRYSTAGSGSVQTWDIQNPPALNAGTYRMYASIGDTDNYYGFEAVYCEFVVAKATPTYTAPTGLTAKYGQTLADVTLPDGWSWMDSSESVGGASTAAKTFQAKFTPKDTENYNTVENIELEVTVNKADGGNLKTVELEQKYTDASDHTYTPDWAGLPAGQDWTFSSEASIVLSKQDFAADGSFLTYAISGGKAGDKITITLKASCDNYEDFTITLNVTLTEKDDQQALRITGGTTVVYGQTLALNTSGGSGSGAVTYTVVNGTGEATIDPNTGVLTPVKVGSVSVIATKAGDNDYNAVTSAPVEITITKATPTGEPKYTEIKTGGKTLADAALTIEGSTLKPNAGTLEWVDDKGNVLSNDTKVEANTTYKWRFTPTDGNYTVLTGSIELYHKSSSGGSGWYYTYYTIKATAGTNGSISPSGWTSVRDGRDQTFTITPDKGYAVAKVLVDGKSVGAVKSYTFKNVTKDHTIEAIFMKSNGNPQTGVFVDVAEGSYYEEAIDWAVEKGITNGVSSNMFAPNDPCTRAQIVTFLWRAAGSPAPKSMSSFTDVPADAFYAKAVAWAVENGITSGTGESKFSPNATCTRAQSVTFLYRASGSPAVSGSAEFSDVATNAYYADAVAWAAKKGITTGIGGGLFGSDNDCTRGQIVTFLWRAMAE